MRLSVLAEKLARAQAAHPWRFLAAALAVTAVAGYFASGLRFDSAYEALLPQDSPQVISANAVRDLTGGTRQLVVAISGDDPAQRLAFGRRLVPLFQRMEGIRSVDLEFPVDFVRERGLWLLDHESMVELVEAAEQARRIYRERRDARVLRLFAARVRNTLEARGENVPYNGVLTSRDGRYTFLILIPSVSLSDLPAGRALLNRIQRTVESEDPAGAGVRVRYAGTLTLYQEQHQAIGRDLRNASLVAFVLGILLVTGFTRRLSAPAVIALALLCGIAWTYGLARLFTDRVNMVTGFLGAVLVGLGIDFGIHLFVRFQQELRKAKGELDQALAAAVAGTLRPALTSALTTAATFASFSLAEFPPFYEFGLIAGTGVVMTLASTFWILPPLLALSTRQKARDKARAAGEITLPRPQKARPFPKPLAAAVLTLFGAGAGYGAAHLTHIEFRNNFRELRGISAATEFTDYVSRNMGIGFNPAVYITPTPEEARRIAALAREAHADRSGDPPYVGPVLSVADLLPPADVATRRALIERLRAVIEDEELRRALPEGEEVERMMDLARRMVRVEPWTADDLPAAFRERLITVDGRGYITFVWPSESVESDFQAMAWERRLNALTERAREAGVSRILMADEALIQGAISQMVLHDAPRVIPVAAVVVLLILIIDYRSLRHSLRVASALVVGMLWFVGLMHLLGMTVNMFNLVVIPSVIGIGIDASVHIYHRYRSEGLGSLPVVLRTTGVAVFLASTTTAIGFGSALVCHQRGLQSLGTLAIAGIGATFIAAVLYFPALLAILENRNSNKENAGAVATSARPKEPDE